MGDNKKSKDYIRLRELFAKGYAPKTISIKLGVPSDTATIDLKVEEGEDISLTSSSRDVVLLAFSLKSLHNKYGDPSLGEVRDLDKFFQEAEMLADVDKERLKAAGKILMEGKSSYSYFPHRLFRSFMEEDSDKNYKPYLKLKDDYHIIKALQIEELKIMLDAINRIRNQNSEKTQIFNLILDLFRVFHRDSNFLRNYHLFQKFNQTEPMDTLISTNKLTQMNEKMFEMISLRKGVPAEEGLTRVINMYADMSENLQKLLNIVRGAIEISEGKIKLVPHKSSDENYKIIKENPKFSIIVEDFDPRIRHGKAHNNFDIDIERNIVNFYSEGRLRKLSVSYPFEHIRKMWHRIHLLLSTLAVAVCVEQATLIGVVLDSPEYKHSLLRLGNFRPLK